MALVNQGGINVLQAASSPSFTGRMRGLDAIRYICAAWVVLGHMGSPFRSIESPGFLIKLVSSVYQVAINGPAAVIVFFVISGLCIHFPYATGKKIDYFSYYMRRYIRISLPLFAAVAFTQLLSHTTPHAISIASLNDSVLWSLVAELIYYTIYPFLMFIKRRVGWKGLLLAAFVAAYTVVFSHPHILAKGFYPLFGWKLNWILGLPCWLLGCLLAEKISLSHSEKLLVPQAKHSIWKWRIGIWVASCSTILLQFHQPGGFLHFGYSITLNFFAILVYFWLREEISYSQTNPPVRWLESAGAGSFSLYLVHPIILDVLSNYQNFLGHSILKWLVILCEIILASAIFYFLVEKPSHLLARTFRPNRQATRNSVPTYK